MSVDIFAIGSDAPRALTSPIDSVVPTRPRSVMARQRPASIAPAPHSPQPGSAATGRTCNAPLHGCSAFFSLGREYAWGDIHGDFEALRELVRLSEVGTVDGAGGAEWTCGEGTTVIILGDVVDRWRGPHTMRDLNMKGLARSVGEIADEEALVLRTIHALAESAEREGSRVIRLVGNHELLQMDTGTDANTGLATYAYQMYYSSDFARGGATAESGRRRYESFRSGPMHALVGACAPKAIVQVGSHVYCHGGLNLGQIEYATRHGRNVLDFANDVLDDLLAGGSMFTKEDQLSLLTGADATRGGTRSFSGVLWEDGVSTSKQPNNVCTTFARDVLHTLREHSQRFPPRCAPLLAEAEHFVVAHHMQTSRAGERAGYVPVHTRETDTEIIQTTASNSRVPRAVYTALGIDPSPFRQVLTAKFQGINALCEGMVWRMDVGMSRAFVSAQVADQAEYLRARAPAVLKIVADGRSYDIITSKIVLPGTLEALGR